MQQGDIGAPIRFELVDGANVFTLPPGSSVELWIAQPSKRTLRRLFTITDATNGLVYYETVPGDLADFGRYRFQARAVLPGGKLVGFEPVDVDVGRNVFPAAVYVLPLPVLLPLQAPEVSIVST